MNNWHEWEIHPDGFISITNIDTYVFIQYGK